MTGIRVGILLLSLFTPALSPIAAHAAVSSLVVDATSGRTLHAMDADRLRYPASLTKMMTLYLLFEAIDRGTLQPRQPAARLPPRRGAAAHQARAAAWADDPGPRRYPRAGDAVGE